MQVTSTDGYKITAVSAPGIQTNIWHVVIVIGPNGELLDRYGNEITSGVFPDRIIELEENPDGSFDLTVHFTNTEGEILWSIRFRIRLGTVTVIPIDDEDD